jgi:hypothetical protein
MLLYMYFGMNSQLRTKKPLEAAQYIGVKNPRYLYDSHIFLT